MKPLKTTFFFILLFIVSTQSFAQEAVKKTSPLKFLIVSSLEFGGDKIAEVYFTNGEKQGVRAGQGISVGAGGQLQIPGTDKFFLRSTVGFKYVTTAADNVHIRLTRIPIIVSGNFMASPKLRLGAGIAMHRNIRFKADGLGDDHKFKGANGPTFEIAYAGVGIGYTVMKYKDGLNNSYSANAIAISYSIAIPNK